MCRNENKRNVREGGIQEWILKESQKKEKGKGTLINYGKKIPISREKKDNTEKSSQ